MFIIAFSLISLSIAYHDLRGRLIYLWEIMLMGLLVLLDGWIKIPLQQLLEYWLINWCFLLFLGLVLWFYLFFKTGKAKVAL
ncbi:MAG: hypothetical protein AAFV80_20560, partial [Bacteroidota bacterium]